MIKYYNTQLPNKLTVLTAEMPFVNSVSINITVQVGSRYEALHENGITHFLEHMAFKGTKTRSAKNIAEEFDNIGGYFNAYTSKEYTVYFAKVLKENFEQALEILSDILQNSVFSPEEIEKEKNVILQEIAQSNDNPEDLVFEKLSEITFPGQSLGRSILGLEENISKFTSQYFNDYLKNHYFGANIFISVAGNTIHSEASDLVNKYFIFENIGKRGLNMAANYVNGVSIIEKDLEQTSLALAFEGVPYTSLKDSYEAQILSVILGGSSSSRLFQEIRENLGLAYSVGSFINSYSDTGIFGIYGGTSADKAEEFIKLSLGEVEKIFYNLEEKEIMRAKAQIKSNLIMAQERPSYKAEEIAKNFAVFGKFIGLEEILASISAINKNDIISIAEKIFSSKISISIVGKKTADIKVEKFL